MNTPHTSGSARSEDARWTDLLRGLPALAKAQVLMTLRSKTALFWALAFPLIFLLVFGFVFGRGEPDSVAFLLPGLLTINILSASFMGITMQVVAAREAGELRRLRVTPISAVTVILSYSAASLLTQSLTLVTQLAIAKLLFRIPLFSSLVWLPVVALSGFWAFIPLGLFVASVAKDTRTAPALTNLIFFPMMFLSGAAFPFAFLPDFIKKIARVLPATYLVEGFQGVFIRVDGLVDLLPALAVLWFTGFVATFLDGLLFRWESDEPVDRRRLLVAVGSLAAVFGGAALLGPQLGMSQMPSTTRPEPAAAKGQVRVLRGVTVIDGLGGRVPAADVVIRDNRIAEIRTQGPGAGLPKNAWPKNAVVEDRTGLFLMPGLIDSHVHLASSAGGMVPGSLYEFSAERQVRDLQAYLGAGVTSVLSLYDDPEALARLREEVRRGRMRAPRVFFAGAAVTAPEGFPVPFLRFNDAVLNKLTKRVATPQEAQKAIEDLDKRRVNVFFLVLYTGGGKTQSKAFQRMDEATFRAAIAAAKKERRPTTVLVSNDEDIGLALEAGADGIENAPSDLTDDTIRKMAQKGTTLTPSLMFLEGLRGIAAVENVTDPLVQKWTDNRIIASLFARESWLSGLKKPETAAGFAEALRGSAEAVTRAFRGGVKVLAGTNSGTSGVFHGSSLVRELELLVAMAGLTPQEALLTATSRAADRLNQPEFGRIVPNAFADLLLLGSDPTADIRALRDVRAVYLNGLPIDRDRLFETRAGSWLP